MLTRALARRTSNEQSKLALAAKKPKATLQSQAKAQLGLRLVAFPRALVKATRPLRRLVRAGLRVPTSPSTACDLAVATSAQLASQTTAVAKATGLLVRRPTSAVLAL